MRDRHIRRLLSLPLLFASISCGGGGGDGPTTPTPPTTPTASAIAVASGNSQTGKAEAALSAPLVVKVSSNQGAGISGVTVTFAATSGAVNPATATTDASGNAQSAWTLGSAIGQQTATATAAGLSGSPVSFQATATSAWTLDATILTNASFGGAQGALADVAVLKLNDGRYRMIIGASPGTSSGLRSAISTDGITFTLEDGVRTAVCSQQIPCFYHPFVMRLEDGRVKLFMGLPNTNQGFASGIYSFTSTDEGQTFSLDAGVRVTAAAAGTDGVSGPSIVKMQSGGWRMYFSNAVRADGTGPQPTKIVSAFSTDLVSWTMDAGVRVGAGSSVLTGRGEHPGSIANADGSVTLVYFRNNGMPTGLFYATSADGLTFTREARTGFGFETVLGQANDPFLMQLSNGDVRMYANWGDDSGGSVFTARRAPFTVNTPTP